MVTKERSDGQTGNGGNGSGEERAEPRDFLNAEETRRPVDATTLRTSVGLGGVLAETQNKLQDKKTKDK